MNCFESYLDLEKCDKLYLFFSHLRGAAISKMGTAYDLRTTLFSHVVVIQC